MLINKKRRRYNRNRSRIRIGNILLILLLAAVLGAAGFGVKKIIDSTRLQNKYDEARYASVYTLDEDSALLDLFALDLCVVRQNSSDPDYSAESGLVCSDGSMYADFSASSFVHMNPASTTKIMTALLALKYGNTDDLITVGEEAVIREEGASLAKIMPGDRLTLYQLLYGLLLPSGNDAANAIAVYVSGSVEKFIDLMNEEAAKLGCVDTHFRNAHGITEDNHYTSAYDLYLILNEAVKYDVFNDICCAKTYVCDYTNASGEPVTRSWNNANKYITEEVKAPEGLKILAGKTGTTMAAGNCLALAVTDENDKKHFSIVLKASGKDELYRNMNHILEKIQ